MRAQKRHAMGELMLKISDVDTSKVSQYQKLTSFELDYTASVHNANFSTAQIEKLMIDKPAIQGYVIMMKTIVNIFSLKKVPGLFWTAPTPLTIKPPAISVLFLLLGLIVFGFGHAILFAANLGVSPWMVLSQVITVQTGWRIGWIIIAVSVLVL